jgi:Flp pilus assembly protein TadB
MTPQTTAATVFANLLTLAFLWWMSNRSKQERRRDEQQRLAVLQAALDHPQLDAATRQELTRVLVDQHREAKDRSGRTMQKVARGAYVAMLGAGWLGALVGGGMWALGAADGMRFGQLMGAIAVTLTGVAVITLPIALRELMYRSARTAVQR